MNRVSELSDMCKDGNILASLKTTSIILHEGIVRTKPHDSGFRAQNVAPLQL